MSVITTFLDMIFRHKEKEQKEQTYKKHYSYDSNSEYRYEIKAGQKWEFTPTPNPFNANDVRHMVEIKDYKDGWVNYRFLNGGLFQNNAEKESIFRKMYKLKEN